MTNTAFRLRGLPPALYLPFALAFTAWRPPVSDGAGPVIGIILIALGLALRAFVVGHVPHQTSGRGSHLRARSLNTDGAYSCVRHPLYVGNLLIWVGTTALSGHVTLVLGGALLFAVTLPRVVAAEDAFLEARFGETFRAWRASTPAFLPRRRVRYRRPGLPFSVRTVLRRESTTWWTVGLAIALFARARHETWHRPVELGFLAILTALWLVVHGFKYATRVLHVPGR